MNARLIFLFLLLLPGEHIRAEIPQVPKAGAISVPIRFNHKQVVAQAKINGHGPFNVLLDTGADPSVINLATARQIGLKIESTGGRGTGTGTDVNLAYGTTLPSIELGGLHATNVEAVAMDLSKISKSIGPTPRQSVGFNGAATSRQGKIGKVTIGGISVSNPMATFFNKGTGYDDEAWGVRIGTEFMEHYIVTFDFQSMEISFVRP